MEEFLLIALAVSFVYAIVLVSTLGRDIVTGRFKRSKLLREDMSRTQAKLDNIRIRSKKLWESVESD